MGQIATQPINKAVLGLLLPEILGPEAWPRPRGQFLSASASASSRSTRLCWVYYYPNTPALWRLHSVALRPVYSDATQLNSTRRRVEFSWVELRRYRHPHRRNCRRRSAMQLTQLQRTANQREAGQSSWVESSCVAIDTSPTQLNSTRRRVELSCVAIDWPLVKRRALISHNGLYELQKHKSSSEHKIATTWWRKVERTYNTVKYVERRLKIEMHSESVHLEEHLEDEQTEKDELGIVWTQALGH